MACLVSKFSARIQLSGAASLSGIGVTAGFWSAVKRVSKFTSGSVHRGFRALFKKINFKIFVLIA